MIVVIHLDIDSDIDVTDVMGETGTANAGDAADAIRADAEKALQALAARPGYVRGSAGPAVDDPACWVLAMEWERVGDYRRALGSYEVKLHATPLLARARDQPSAFEQIIAVDPDGTVRRSRSDRTDSR